MKDLLHLIICLATFSYSISTTAQPFQGEEAKVYKAIEDDIKYFDQRDYENWAAMWVHEPYVQNVWVGPNEYNGQFSWDALDKGAKVFMKNSPEPVPTDFQGQDFSFLIKEDLAVVAYTAQGERFTRVLEKRDNKWKMAQILRVQLGAYQAKTFLNQLDKMKGKWILLPESVTVNNSNWGLTHATCLATSTLSGIRLQFQYQIKNPAGDLQEAQEEIMIALNSADQQMLATRIWHWLGSGQTYVSTGKGAASEAGGVTVNTTAIGPGKQKVQHHIKNTTNGDLVMESIFFPQQASEWSMSFSMTRE